MSTLFVSFAVLTKLVLCCVCKSTVTVNQQIDITVLLHLVGKIVAIMIVFPSSHLRHIDIRTLGCYVCSVNILT